METPASQFFLLKKKKNNSIFLTKCEQFLTKCELNVKIQISFVSILDSLKEF